MKGKQHDSFNTWTSWVMSMKSKTKHYCFIVRQDFQTLIIYQFLQFNTFEFQYI